MFEQYFSTLLFKFFALSDVTSSNGYDNLGRGHPAVFKKHHVSSGRPVNKITEGLKLFL